MLKITYNDYIIEVRNDSCTIKHTYKNKNMRQMVKIVGHVPDVPTAIKRIAEHGLHSQARTIELREYLKQYRDMVDEFWKLIK